MTENKDFINEVKNAFIPNSIQINLQPLKSGIVCVLLYKSVEVVAKGMNVQ